MAFRRPSRDLLWVLGVAFALRFFHSDALLLGTNSWRQCDNASIARNYAEHGMRFPRPEVDWGGAGQPPGGVVQMEFPAYQYAVAGLYRVAGVRDWLGRWVSIAASLLAIVFLYNLVLNVSGSRPAGWAGFFFAVLPLNAYYGRAFMVESSMICALLGGVWAFERWLARGRAAYFWVAAAGISLGCLLKIPSLYIGLPLLVLAWNRMGWRLVLRPALWGFAAVVLVPVAWWYSWSGNLLAETGLSLMGDWRYGTDKWGDWGLAASPGFWNRVIFSRLAGKHLTWAGLVILAWGLLGRRRRRDVLFDSWLLAAAIGSAIVSRGSFVHEHYQLWFVTPAAAVMGLAFGRHWRTRFWRTPAAAASVLVLAAFLVLAAWRYADMSALESPEESGSWRLAVMIREHTEPEALVVSLDGKDPTAMYHARRRGWNTHVNDLAAGGDAWLRAFASRGAVYLAARHEQFMDPDRTALVRRIVKRYKLVADDGATFVVRLKR